MLIPIPNHILKEIKRTENTQDAKDCFNLLAHPDVLRIDRMTLFVCFFFFFGLFRDLEQRVGFYFDFFGMTRAVS